MGALAVVVVVALTGCTAPEPEPEELTVSAAGARYLDAICPVNAAWEGVDLEVDRLRLVLSRGDTGDTAAIGGALADLERASTAASETLSDETVAWPAKAEGGVAEVAETLAADAEQAARAAKLPAVDLVDYSWEGVKAIGSAAAATRAALGLPEGVGSACADRPVSAR
ncbi:hypothetical protein FB468_0030 [Leucobacter komagatae]|uniref:Uncharacterized protein n=1 Tax=Leucobacter komagatae TaxID=55969 RepID=A0A542Y1U8_9MICO|nr:hypothetical protein FB468_0030 [Leucobacter komagatae]